MDADHCIAAVLNRCDAAVALGSRDAATGLGHCVSESASGGMASGGAGGIVPPPRVVAQSSRAILSAALGLAETGQRTAALVSSSDWAHLAQSLNDAASRHVPLVAHAALSSRALAQLDYRLPPAGRLAALARGWLMLCPTTLQEAADAALIAHRIAELALTPVLVWRDGLDAANGWQNLNFPEKELAETYLGQAEAPLVCPTPAQELVFGAQRRRVPRLLDEAQPGLSGAGLNATASEAKAISDLLFFQDHTAGLVDRAFAEFGALTGRCYRRVIASAGKQTQLLVVATGATAQSAEAVLAAAERGLPRGTGLARILLLAPFPGDQLSPLLLEARRVCVMEAEAGAEMDDPPLARRVRGALHRCLENGAYPSDSTPHPGFARAPAARALPELRTIAVGLNGLTPGPGEILAGLQAAAQEEAFSRIVVSGTGSARKSLAPAEEVPQQQLLDAYPRLQNLKPAIQAAGERPANQGLSLRVVAAPRQGLFLAAGDLARWFAEQTSGGVRVWPPHWDDERGKTVSWELAAGDPVHEAASPPQQVSVLLCLHESLLDSRQLANLRSGGTLLLWLHRKRGTAWSALTPEIHRELSSRKISLHFLDLVALEGGLGGGSGNASETGLGGDPKRNGDNEARGESNNIPPLDNQTSRALLLAGCVLGLDSARKLHGLGGAALLTALRDHWLNTPGRIGHGLPGALEWLRAGIEQVETLRAGSMGEAAPASAAGLPSWLKQWPLGRMPMFDPHQLWARLGRSTLAGGLQPLLPHPHLALSRLPASSGLLRDNSPLRLEHPQWLPEHCDGCGVCWMLCPESALFANVCSPRSLLGTALADLEARGNEFDHLPRAVRPLEGQLTRALSALSALQPSNSAGAALQQAITQAIAASPLAGAEKGAYTSEMKALSGLLNELPCGITERFFTEPEQTRAGSGGVLAIALNPQACTGCKACVVLCPQQALRMIPEQEDSPERLRKPWEFWLALPDAEEQHLREAEALPPQEGEDQARPGLETQFLRKPAALAFSQGGVRHWPEDARVMLHLFAGMAVTAAKPGIIQLNAQIAERIEALEALLKAQLALEVSDTEGLRQSLAAMDEGEVTLGDLSQRLAAGNQPLDTNRLRRVSGWLAALKQALAWLGGEDLDEAQDPAGAGAQPVLLGLMDDSGGFAPGYPFNPFSFTCAFYPAAGGQGTVLGVFEGILARRTQLFRLLRQSALELADRYYPALHDEQFSKLSWRDLTLEERAACPPLLVVIRAAASGSAGVVELLETGLPIKILCLDDLAGKPEPAGGRTGAESLAPPGGMGFSGGLGCGGLNHPALLALGMGDPFVWQGGLGNLPQLLLGFQRALRSPRPALLNAFQAVRSATEGGIVAAVAEAALAWRSRTHPCFIQDPQTGEAPRNRLELDDNPHPEDDWDTGVLPHLDAQGHKTEVEQPITYADFALGYPEMDSHFKQINPTNSQPEPVPLTHYLDLAPAEQEESLPFVTTLGARHRPEQLEVSPAIVQSSRTHRQIWRLLRALAGRERELPEATVEAGVTREEIAEQVWRNLVTWASEESTPPQGLPDSGPSALAMVPSGE